MMAWRSAPASSSATQPALPAASAARPREVCKQTIANVYLLSLLGGGEFGRIDTLICSRLRRSRNTPFQCRRSRFHFFQCFPPLLPLSQKAPQALSHVPSLSEQIVKRHFRLDVRRILVLRKSVCRYISHVYGLARPCFTLEGRLLVSHFGIVFGVERILLRREFHFAKVDYSIAAVNQQVDLGALLSIIGRMLAPPRIIQ